LAYYPTPFAQLFISPVVSLILVEDKAGMGQAWGRFFCLHYFFADMQAKEPSPCLLLFLPGSGYPE